MSGKPKILEKYTKGKDVIYFSIYDGKHGGEDEVLQHQLFGTTETAHITLHPDGKFYLRPEKGRSEAYVKTAVSNKMNGYSPAPSPRLRAFLVKAINAKRYY